MQKTQTLFAQFWLIHYITSEFNFHEKKTETLSTQHWVIIYITTEFNFFEKNKHFIGLVLGDNLHN